MELCGSAAARLRGLRRWRAGGGAVAIAGRVAIARAGTCQLHHVRETIHECARSQPLDLYRSFNASAGAGSEPVRSPQGGSNPQAAQVADFSKTQRADAFETTKFSAYGITTQSGSPIVGRDIRDTDLITIDGMEMTIGAARHLGLVSPDRT